MQVWVISELHETADGRGNYSTPECIVLHPHMMPLDYTYKSFTVIGSNQQKEALAARAEISELSQAARDKLGITFHQVAALSKAAEPPMQLEPGDSLYISVYSGEDGRGKPVVTGVYTWDRRDDMYESCRPLKVYQDLEAYLQEKNTAAIDKEISAVSPATRRLLGLKP